LSSLKSHIQAEIDLSSKKRRLHLVLFSVIFSFFFVNIFEPFGFYNNESITQGEVFVEIAIAMLAALVMLLLSQFALREIFNIKRFVFSTLIAWFFLEALLVTATWILLEYIEDGAIASMSTTLINNFLQYVLIFFIPYFLYAGYVYLTDKATASQQFASGQQESIKNEFVITDENNKTQLIVQLENLLFAQSADNYVEVHYLKDGVVEKQLIRNSIKQIESVFDQSPVIRCHRSYIVNTTQIELAKKTSSGYKLRLKHTEFGEIPVSKSYMSELAKFLA